MRRRLAPLAKSLTGLLITFLVCELGARAWKGEWRAENFLAEGLDLFHSAYPSEFDPRLGWIPRADMSGGENIWGTTVTTGESGIRSAGSGVSVDRAGAPGVLCVGDSFTFGDEVSDAETWPAQLQGFGLLVVNAGVFGYGIDQCWLRLRELIDEMPVDTVVFSFIPADIERCELSERSGVPKPYFTVEDGELMLHDEHVVFTEHPIGPVRRLLGHSYLVHKLMSRLAARSWYEGRWRSTPVHRDGTAVACAIFDELAAFGRERELDVYLLVQRGKRPSEARLARVDSVLACVDREALTVVDLRPELDAMARTEPDRYDSLFAGHMTAAGNRFVAERLHAAMTASPTISQKKD